jgi:hypothetical protein
MDTDKQELTVNQVKILLQNALLNSAETEGITIGWKDLRKVHTRGYVFQLVVDRLSLGFIKEIESIPLVKSVHFFPKVGTGQHGINLLFKMHIVFEKL